MSREKEFGKRGRGANYTAEEKTLLSELVMKYKYIVEDKRSGGIFIKRKRDAWVEIAQKYNANCTSGRRELDQLKSLYDNMKQKARKNLGESNKIEYIARMEEKTLITQEDVARALQNIKDDKVQMNKTGGGVYKAKTTETDEKILAISSSSAIYFKYMPSTSAVDVIDIEDGGKEKKCENAYLEKKYLMIGILNRKREHALHMLQMKEEHKLNMEILRKQL
ncbi:uncharacterized protein LOC105390071 [Plutella xylostella]|uniref:uncharacterized protein LOC105390071 n=1 Tax=Plutella xylostella TaxID=51655 RepID=UPI0020327F0B|nr:uncharacterized protein LOC105390071 [Plutella xylostella]